MFSRPDEELVGVSVTMAKHDIKARQSEIRYLAMF